MVHRQVHNSRQLQPRTARKSSRFHGRPKTHPDLKIKTLPPETKTPTRPHCEIQQRDLDCDRRLISSSFPNDPSFSLTATPKLEPENPIIRKKHPMATPLLKQPARPSCAYLGGGNQFGLFVHSVRAHDHVAARAHVHQGIECRTFQRSRLE